MLAQLLEFSRQQQGPAQNQASDKHHHQGRHDAAGTAQIEAQDAGTVAAHLPGQGGGDQIAGHDQEDVHPDEAAGQDGGEGMEGDHQRDGDGAQTVDVGAVGRS